MIQELNDYYLNKTCNKVADIFDVAINDYKIERHKFIETFINHPIITSIENKETKYLMGASSIEIVMEMFNINKVINVERFEGNKIHWAGKAISYYMYLSGYKFKDIFEVIDIDELISLYHPLHESSLDKFYKNIDKRMNMHFKETNLARIRKSLKYSQSQLSKASGVSLRSIQLYEQRQKDINQASYSTLHKLSTTLGLNVEDIVEVVRNNF